MMIHDSNYQVVSRSFVSEAFVTGAGFNVNALPWYSDLIHLVFWFFFLTSFILGIWLIQTFYVLIRCGESKFPIRETRGFSRAQTGDSLTAVIPMCWSITMLMHASVHSSNFDENTDSTSITITVMAYQWGWNYFFPLDTSKIDSRSLTITPEVKKTDFFLNLNRLNRPELSNVNLISFPLNPKRVGLSNVDHNFVNNSEVVVCEAPCPEVRNSEDFLLTSNLINPHELGLKKKPFVFKKLKDLSYPNSPQVLLGSPYLDLKQLPLIIEGQTRFDLNTWESTLSNIPSISNLSTNTNVINSETLNNSLTLNLTTKLPLPKLGEDYDQDFFNQEETSEFGMTRQPATLTSDLLLTGGLVSRFRITSALLLPSDYPIHLICGSKDVIHSWAIPGLGIKIDCIPGFNCHRRVLIRWRGLFWGQCMEVCGRYHHWMPILVRVTSLDLFLLWLKSWL